MSIKTEDVEKLMKRCQIGVGGRGALETAHEIMAECYGTLGALVQERDRLQAALYELIECEDDRQPQWEERITDAFAAGRRALHKQ